MSSQSKISLSNRAFFYSNQKNTCTRHEELQDSNLTKRYLSLGETTHASFSKLPKLCSSQQRANLRYPKIRVCSQAFENAGQSLKSNALTRKVSLFSKVRSVRHQRCLPFRASTCFCVAEENRRGLKPNVLNPKIKNNQHNKLDLRRSLSSRLSSTLWQLSAVRPSHFRSLTLLRSKSERSESATAGPRALGCGAPQSKKVSESLRSKGSRCEATTPFSALRAELLLGPFGSKQELRSSTRPNANAPHSLPVDQKALHHRWLLCKGSPIPFDALFGFSVGKAKGRNLSRQWLEKVGFTFSPFAFIFGTTFLFAALANTLQKQAGKQWLQTLSHTKLPGLTENKVSQLSSWVFFESVLSQYINRDNSLLVSTSYLAKDAPYSAKVQKARPRTLPPFLDQPKAEREQPELYFGSFDRAKSANGGVELGATLAETEPSQRPGRLPQNGVQIRLSPLWSHHLKKDFLGVFPRSRRTSSVCVRSEKGFTTLGLSRSSEQSLNKSKIGRLQNRSSGLTHLPVGKVRKGFITLANYRRGFIKPANSVPFGLPVGQTQAVSPLLGAKPRREERSVIAPELKTTIFTCPWYKITAYYPPNRFIVPTWNDSTTAQVEGRLDLIRVKPAKTKLDVAKQRLPFVNGAVEYAPKNAIQTEGVTLPQINFNSASLISEAPDSAFTKSVEGDIYNEHKTLLSKDKSEPEQTEGLLSTTVDHPVHKSDGNYSTPLRKKVVNSRMVNLRKAKALGTQKWKEKCLECSLSLRSLLLRKSVSARKLRLRKEVRSQVNFARSRKYDRNLLALYNQTPSWFFGSPSNEHTPFGCVNTRVQRLRLEDDSIPSKKDSIYSKNKRPQDSLSARVLHVVKKSFYDYGVSMTHLPIGQVRAAQLLTPLAAQLPSRAKGSLCVANGFRFAKVCHSSEARVTRETVENINSDKLVDSKSEAAKLRLSNSNLDFGEVKIIGPRVLPPAEQPLLSSGSAKMASLSRSESSRSYRLDPLSTNTHLHFRSRSLRESATAGTRALGCGAPQSKKVSEAKVRPKSGKETGTKFCQPEASLAFTKAKVWSHSGLESANYSQAGYECGPGSGNLVHSAKPLLHPERMSQDGGCPASVSTISSTKPGQLGLFFKNIARPKKNFWEYANSLSGYNFPELQDHEVTDLFKSKLRFGRIRKKLKVAACLQSKVGMNPSHSTFASLRARRASHPKGFTNFREAKARKGDSERKSGNFTRLTSLLWGAPHPRARVSAVALSRSESERKYQFAKILFGPEEPKHGRVAHRVATLLSEAGRELNKVDKADKLGVTPSGHSWFCTATNQVFLTPYLIKKPPKVLVAASNKTESITLLKTEPLSLSEHSLTLSRSESEQSDNFRSLTLLRSKSERDRESATIGPRALGCSAPQSKKVSAADSDFSFESPSGQVQSKLLLVRAHSPVEQEGHKHGNCHLNLGEAKVSGARVLPSTGLPEQISGGGSTARVNNADYQPEHPLVEGLYIRYTPLDLKQENRVKKAFKELGRHYSDYSLQPKDSLPALLLSPSLEEDKQIEEEEFQRLAHEKAAAKAAAKRTQNEEEYKTSDSATIEEEFNILDPLEVDRKKGKNNVIHDEEEVLNDEEIEDSRFERLRFTRELEPKKEEEDCRGLALSLTPRGSNLPIRDLERVGRTKLLPGCPPAPSEHGQPELRSNNFVRARSKISSSTFFRPVFGLVPSQTEHEQELCSTRTPSLAQFAPKKLETKVSERKHSFFGQRSFWPTRLFSQEERLVSEHVINPYIRYDQKNPWLIREQDGGLPYTSPRGSFSRASSVRQSKRNDNSRRNLPHWVPIDGVSDSASCSAKLSTSTETPFATQSEPRTVYNVEPSSGALTSLHTKTCQSDDLQNLKNLQTQARLGLIRFVHFPLVCGFNKRTSNGTPLVESVSYTHKTANQNRIYKSDPRLRLTPLESSLSADWRNERKVEASPFRVTSKDQVHIVLPKLSEKQWQKSIEWQLKKHFLDEDTRLKSLVATEPFKTFKAKKIERSLPWLTMAGTEHVRFSERHRRCWPFRARIRLTDSNFRQARLYDVSSKGGKKPCFKLFQWPYKTVGVVSPLALSDRGSAIFSATGCDSNPQSTTDCVAVLTREKGLPITFFEEGSCSAKLSTFVFPPPRILNYSRLPLASNLTTYSKDSSALSISSNSLFDVRKNLFSSQGDLKTQLLFEVPSNSSWFLIYRLFLAKILKEVFKYIYRITLKDLFIRIINSDFGRTITSSEFRHRVQFEPFPEFYKPKNRLKDLIGIKNAFLPLSEIIWFLRNNCRSRNGPHGVILIGPEGVDTTAIAQAVAGEAKVPIIVQSLRALTLTHSHPQKRLEKVLLLARAQAPCVLFLDELDVIGQSRQGTLGACQNGQGIEGAGPEGPGVIRKTSGEGDSLLSLDASQSVEGPIQFQSPDEQPTSQGRRVDLMLRLLTVMDGLHHLNGVVILTTSKSTATLDPALLRPGRFDRLIHLTLPNHEQRVELFKAKTRRLNSSHSSFASVTNFREIAKARGASPERSSDNSARSRKCEHTNPMPLDERSSLLSVDELEYLSLRTANMSGADIVSAINYSTLRAIVNETVHTVETLEYGLNCVKALKYKKGRRNRSRVAT